MKEILSEIYFKKAEILPIYTKQVISCKDDSNVNTVKLS